MPLTVRINDAEYRVDIGKRTPSLVALHESLSEVLAAWMSAPDQSVMVVEGEDPDSVVRAIGLLWAKRIRPTIAQMTKDFADRDKSPIFFEQLQSTSGHFVHWNKPIGTPAPPAVVALLRTAPATKSDFQKAWTDSWNSQLAREIAHAKMNRLGALRFLRGARLEGFMDDDEFAAAARGVGAPELIGTLFPTGQSTAIRPFSGQRILLAEDQLYWEPLVKPVLRRDGLALEVRTTIRQTLELLEQRSTEFSAIILDLHYELEPEGEDSDPRSIVRRVVDVAPQLPIVVFTSDTDGRLTRALVGHVARYFFKEYEAKGSGDPVAYIGEFRKAISDAIAQGGTQAARACCRAINAPPEFLTLLERQAELLESPAAALSLNVGLKAQGLGPYSWGSAVRNALRNYGAHLEVAPPTLYDALASHIMWIAAAAGMQQQSPALLEKVAATIRAFGRSSRDAFLERVADVLLAEPAARTTAVDALKSAVSVPGYDLLVRSVADPTLLGAHLTPMKRAYEHWGTLSPLETAAQCLLLARLEALCR
jgi:CheY-like chemotaxis protein